MNLPAAITDAPVASVSPASAPLLRTLVIADLVESTALTERLGDQRAIEIFRQHDRIGRDIAARHGGQEIDKTDGFLLMFDRPIRAIAFALDYQQALKTLGRAENVPLSARVGIHVGDVLVWHNSAADVAQGAKPVEVEGMVKPIAARLMGLARPGQILLSGVANALAQRGVRELGERLQHVRFKHHGLFRFKGVAEAMPIFEVGEPGVAPLKRPPSAEKAWREVPWWRRPRALALEFAALLATAAIGFWLAAHTEPAIAFNARDWVVVAELQNHTGESLFDESLDAAFRIGLEQSRYVNLIPDLQMRDALARMKREPATKVDRTVGAEIAQREGARALILPSVAEVGGRIRVSAELIDPRTSVTVYSESADGKGVESVLPAMDKVLRSLRSRLGESLQSVDHDALPLEKVTTGNFEALKAYSMGIRAFISGDYEHALALFERAIRIDPDFASAYAKIAGIHYVASRRKETEQFGKLAAEHADRLAAREKLYVDGILAFSAAPAQAIKAWGLLAQLYPDFYAGQHNLGTILWHDENRFSSAADAFGAVARSRHPQRFASLHFLGYTQLALAHFDEAQKSFEQARALSASPLALGMADLHTARRQYAQAKGFLEQPLGAHYGLWVVQQHLRWIAVDADQGLFDAALEQARRGAEGAGELGYPGEARKLSVIAAVLGGFRLEPAGFRSGLRREANLELAALKADPDALPYRPEQCLLLLSLAASRSGATDDAKRWMAAALPHARGSGFYFRESMAEIAQAQLDLASGHAPVARERMQALVDGREPYQAHVVLAGAARTLHDDKALAHELRWLATNRGRALAEWNEGFLSQALNIAYADLAVLALAQSSSSTDKVSADLLEQLPAAWKQRDRNDPAALFEAGFGAATRPERRPDPPAR